MKRLFKVLLSLLALLILSSIGGYFYMRQKFQAPANQLTVAQLPVTSSFVWLADTTAGKNTLHAALLVPVELPNCPRPCYLQFDTGAPYTLLNSAALEALQKRYPATGPALQPHADSLRNFRFAIGQSQMVARNILVRQTRSAAVPADSTAPFIIGTLGTDLLDGRVLVIDYARQHLQLCATVPDNLARRTDFSSMSFEERRILLTVGLQGTTKQLLFDSGSSAFALLTSKASWQEMAEPAAPVRTAAVNSWGKTLTAYTAPTRAIMQLGTTAVPLKTVSHIEGTTFMQQMLTRFSGLGGMVGNEPFSQRTLILDVKGNRYGVVSR
jgi:hypothetical protein